MLIAHLADLHLGYRAYHRLAPGGINMRERDVSRAFRTTVDRVVELRPQLVLVAGDVFHTVRPSNSAIADAFRQFARLSALLGDVPIVVIAGNHDSPRAIETGSILRLLAEIPNVVVVDDDARAVYLEPLDTSVLCMPHNALLGEERVAMQPDAAASTNVLMLHGTVVGAAVEQKLRFVSEYGGVVIDEADIRPQQWDYVALGHYHIATELADNMWYPGGIERTSTNVWEESLGEKGFVTYDTDTRRARFHTVPTRPVVDLPRLAARRAAADPADEPRYLDAAELDAAIRARVDAVEGGIAEKIVRLVITDVTREVFRELDHRQLRAYRAAALHFHLDVRRPEVRRTGEWTAGQRRTLEEEMTTFLEHHWRTSSSGIETPRLIELARRYLGDAALAESGNALADGPGL